MALPILFIWHFVGSPLFGERLTNALNGRFFGQEEKKGLENSFSLPILDNSKGT